jgi:hypothetical protein
MGYEQVLNLAFLLTKEERERLIKDLQNNIAKKGERKFGKYDGQVWMSDDFNEPLDDFKEYMP